MSEPVLLSCDADLVAVDKPSGWLVHPVGTEAPDVLAWLDGQDVPADVVPVHRLDLETSGVVLFAPKGGAARWAKLFEEGRVEKHYRALVFGNTRDKGVIRRPLADGRRGDALEATTRYRTLEHFAKASLIDVRPETGRKHQIRRHFQGIGHAVVGDTRYRPRGKPTVPGFPGRLWLHAATLAIDGRAFEAPLPAELVGHLGVLREREGAR